MRTRYGLSPWINQFPTSRRPDFPRFRGDLAADVVIVGGGLTGCAIAHACAVAGLRPVLLERRIASVTAAPAAAPGCCCPNPVRRSATSWRRTGCAPRTPAFEVWRERRARRSRPHPSSGHQVRARSAATWSSPRIATTRRLLRREYDARVAAGLDVDLADGEAAQEGREPRRTGGDAHARRVQPRSLPLPAWGSRPPPRRNGARRSSSGRRSRKSAGRRKTWKSSVGRRHDTRRHGHHRDRDGDRRVQVAPPSLQAPRGLSRRSPSRFPPRCGGSLAIRRLPYETRACRRGVFAGRLTIACIAVGRRPAGDARAHARRRPSFSGRAT